MEQERVRANVFVCTGIGTFYGLICLFMSSVLGYVAVQHS